MKIYRSLILVIFASAVASQNSPYTLDSVPAYALQRVCVQNCVGTGYLGLPANIGCPYTYLNACACRTDLQSSASSYLTQCVDQQCSSDPSDLSSAISLYDSYCVSNGYPLLPAISTTAATSFVTPAATATAPTATATSGSTSLTTSSSELVLTLILLSTILVHHLL
jgi:hypothetical protein